MADICLLLWLNSETLNLLEAELAKKSTVKKKNPKVLPVETAVTVNLAAKKPNILVVKILIGFVVLIVMAFLFISSQSDKFRLDREITIMAPEAKIFPELNDFHNWADWSTWEKLDPAIKKTFEDHNTGVGAVCNWIGNDRVGSGKMVITESDSGHINVEVDYALPTLKKNWYTFEFIPNGKETLVKWHFSSDDDFGDKFTHLFIGPDKTLAEDLQNGLEQLKTVTEAAK